MAIIIAIPSNVKEIIGMTSESIGDRLFQVRKAKKLSQQAFAEKLETSSGYVSEVETGKSVPGGKFLLSLNRVFGVDINWLLTGTVIVRYETGGQNSQLIAAQGDPSELINQRELKLLEDFRSLPDNQKDAAETMLHAAAQPKKRKM